MNHSIKQQLFGTTPEGREVTAYTLTNALGASMTVINYGCTITSLNIPDRKGLPGDVVLGFDDLDGYLRSNAYIGCVVGRYANRIAQGKFAIDGQEYTVARNLSPHHLHGGVKGFSHALWNTDEIIDAHSVGLRFRHHSPHDDEGYPGNLNLEVVYLLGDDNTVTFEYHATTDQKTIINLTQHSYFNLGDKEDTILNHELTLYADHFLPVDETMIPTGEIRNVSDTPFDFRKSKRVGLDINVADPQLSIAHGYDHNWVINHHDQRLCLAATLHDPSSGRTMDVFTTKPGIQFYTANFLDNTVPGKNNTSYRKHSGLCLETQHYPDTPNQMGFPSVELAPGEKYDSKTVLSFRIE